MNTDFWRWENVTYCDWSKAPGGKKFVQGTAVTIDSKNKASRKASVPPTYLLRYNGDTISPIV